MKKNCIIASLAALALVALAPTLNSREITLWPYDRLQHEADIIVTGFAEKSEDSGEVVHAQLWQTDFLGVNTTIRITGVLDGRFRGNELTLYTLRLPDDKILNDGPMTVTFRTKVSTPGLATTFSSSSAPEYILFLKRMKDGRYEPVSGPLDALHAVRELRLPPEAK